VRVRISIDNSGILRVELNGAVTEITNFGHHGSISCVKMLHSHERCGHVREAHIDAVIARYIRAFAKEQRFGTKREGENNLKCDCTDWNETHHEAMTHPPDVKGTNVERAQTPSSPILTASTTDATCRRNPNSM
jgi:hypothetical protein